MCRAGAYRVKGLTARGIVYSGCERWDLLVKGEVILGISYWQRQSHSRIYYSAISFRRAPDIVSCIFSRVLEDSQSSISFCACCSEISAVVQAGAVLVML